MSERKRCAACSKEIVGKGLCVEEAYYHPDCFCCDKCKSPLSGKFHKQDGKRICDGCKSCAYCEACRKKIEGKETRSEGRVWHPECFKCQHCQQPIVGNFCRIDGTLCCSKCRDAVAKPKVQTNPSELPVCRGCKQPVQEDESRILADKRDMFHEACFKCTKCAKPLSSYVILESARTYSYQDCPYFCDSCAKFERAAAAEAEASEAAAAASAASCAACGARCGAEDQDAFQLLDGRVLHVSCFKCSRCSACPVADSKGSLSLPLLRSKVDALLRGEYVCTSCMGQGYPQAPAAAPPQEPSKASEESKAAPPEPPETASSPAALPGGTMTLDELRNPEVWKARGVEPGSRELMLSDADFQAAFGVSKEDFSRLAAWKKAQKKRELGLF